MTSGDFAIQMKTGESLYVDSNQPWVENINLELAVKERVLEEQSKSNGLMVLLTPQGVGKTTRVKLAVKSLLDTGMIRGALYGDFTRHEVNNDIEMFKLTKQALGISLDTKESIQCMVPKSENLNKTVVFILDGVERVEKHPQFENYFKQLAVSSYNSRDRKTPFMFLAICNSKSSATTLLTVNGGVKTFPLAAGSSMLGRGVFVPGDSAWKMEGIKWSKSHITTLVSGFVRKRLGATRLPDESWDELLTICVKFASAQCCQEASNDYCDAFTTGEHPDTKWLTMVNDWADFSEFKEDAYKMVIANITARIAASRVHV
jgi:hypothetical protein